MLYQGQTLSLTQLESGIIELCFDLKNESVNKFNSVTLDELGEALTVVETTQDAKALLLTSGKPVFVVGADITEFGPIFTQGGDIVRGYLNRVNACFNRIEDLTIPSLAAINGFALGGGMEVCLSCDYRVMSKDTQVGLPETKLGIIPGWGGTVRLPRLAGVDIAVEWIAGGRNYDALPALNAGVVDAVVEPEQLRKVAINMLGRAIAGKLDYQKRKAQKQSPLPINDIESLMSFETSKMFVKAQAGKRYPAPVKAVQVMQDASKLGRDEALAVEGNAFIELALTPVAHALVGIFLNDQLINKKAKQYEKESGEKIKRAAVLGAGIMGGGIAYQSAYKGIPVKMKDIAQDGLDLGLSEAAKLLNKRVDRGRMTAAKMAEVLNKIEPTLAYSGFDQTDIVIEAVVENSKVKQAVLADVEKNVSEDTIICSNTSTISISHLAEALTRPDKFCGMHFFNPVHAMPLVEVIRGEKTAESTVAKTVAYANALGKKAIVVNDCPGFLVNRVLFPYFSGFSMLLRDGADFQEVDKVMERWGWPMGPAYLMDVVGVDTGVHAEAVMAKGFPERMGRTYKSATDILFEAERLGQKNKKGFYNYELDKKGKPQKIVTDESYQLLASEYPDKKDFSEEEIIARMMIPMATEIARCLEEGVVDSAAEADMALVYGLGFPPFRGGLFRWIDNMGIDSFIAMAESYAHLGELYKVTDGMREMAISKAKYYRAA